MAASTSQQNPHDVPLFDWCHSYCFGRTSNFKVQGRTFYITTRLSYLRPLESLVVCDQAEEQVPLLQAGPHSIGPSTTFTLPLPHRDIRGVLSTYFQLLLLVKTSALAFFGLVLLLYRGPERILRMPHWLWGLAFIVLAVALGVILYELRNVNAGGARARMLGDLVLRHVQRQNRQSTMECPHCHASISKPSAFVRVCPKCRKALNPL